MIVVAGPRIDPASLPAHEGLEVRAYVHDLYRHLAACDLAVVQGGLTTSMELTANRRPFLYFPLRHHFEQNFHVRHRLERYGAGRCMDFDASTPDVIAAAIAEEIGREVDYRPVETDGAARAAALIAELPLVRAAEPPATPERLMVDASRARLLRGARPLRTSSALSAWCAVVGLSAGLSPPDPSSDFIRSSSASTWVCDAICESSRSSWRLVGREVLERAGLDELVHGARARLHLFGLRPRALDRRSRVGHLPADSRRGLTDPHLRLGRRVLRLDHFLLRAERLDARRQLLLVLDELLLLLLELLHLAIEIPGAAAAPRTCARAPAARDPRGRRRAPGAPACRA